MDFLNEEPQPTGVPEWLLTYGDMMSLLLAFFVMIVSMSDLRSEGRVVQAVEAMQRQFGHESPTDEGEQPRPGARAPAPLGSHSMVRSIGTGRSAVVGGVLPFAEDSVELGEFEREQLHALARRMQGKGQKIEIRGHTTRRPLPADGPYKDHWELAFVRCREVQRLLTADGIEPKRLRLSVAGGNEPAYTGDETLRNRENSRVEVFLLDEFTGPNDGGGSSATGAETAR